MDDELVRIYEKAREALQAVWQRDDSISDAEVKRLREMLDWLEERTLS